MSNRRRKRKLFRAAVVEGFGVLVFIGLVLVTIPGLLDATQGQSNDNSPVKTLNVETQKSETSPAHNWQIRIPRIKLKPSPLPLAQVNYEAPQNERLVRVSQARLYITDQPTCR